MRNNVRNCKILLIAVAILLQYWHQKSDAALSSFRTESLGIRSFTQKRNNRDENKVDLDCSLQHYTGLVNEISHLLNNYYYKSSSVLLVNWDEIRERLNQSSSKDEAAMVIDSALRKLGDPYTCYLPPNRMVSKQKTIRGELISTGIILRRSLRLRDIFLPTSQLNNTLSHQQLSNIDSIKIPTTNRVLYGVANAFRRLIFRGK